MKTFTDTTRKMAVKILWDNSWFLEEIAFVVGKSKEWVKNALAEAGVFQSASSK